MMVAPALGQDTHFSFAEVNPLVLNPALAGANFKTEVTFNYRNQWSSLGDPYRSYSAGFHTRLSKDKARSRNIIALGLQMLGDKAGNPGIVNNSFSAVLADHVRLTQDSKIGAGISLGFGQRRLESLNGQWATQYNGVRYDPQLSSGESFRNPDFRYFDLGAGIVYSYRKNGNRFVKSDQLIINAGVSAYHLNRPENSFSDVEQERQFIRFSAFANGEIALGTKSAALLPGIYYLRQGNFSELLLGTYYKFKIIEDTRYTGFNKPLSFSLGLFTRIQDAAIIKTFLDWDQYSLGYAFDFNTSKLNSYSNGNGAHEIFLRFALSEITPSRKSRY